MCSLPCCDLHQICKACESFLSLRFQFFLDFPSRHLKRVMPLKFFKQLSRCFIQATISHNHYVSRKALTCSSVIKLCTASGNHAFIPKVSEPDNEGFTHEWMDSVVFFHAAFTPLLRSAKSFA